MGHITCPKRQGAEVVLDDVSKSMDLKLWRVSQILHMSATTVTSVLADGGTGR